MKKTRGKILTKNDVESIELMLKKGFNLAEISRIIGCSDTTVSPSVTADTFYSLRKNPPNISLRKSRATLLNRSLT